MKCEVSLGGYCGYPSCACDDASQLDADQAFRHSLARAAADLHLIDSAPMLMVPGLIASAIEALRTAWYFAPAERVWDISLVLRTLRELRIAWPHGLGPLNTVADRVWRLARAYPTGIS